MSEYDIDDNCLLEALESLENPKLKNDKLINTPPDSEIIGKNKISSNSPIKENISKNDFRLKLLKSISVTQDTFESSIANNSEIFKTSNDENFEHSDNLSDCENFNIPKILNNNIRNLSSRTNKIITLSDTSKHNNIENSVHSPIVSLNYFSRTNLKPTVVKRKFPGPAGLLPINSYKEINSHEEKKSETCYTEENICSQNSAQNYLSAAWDKMLIDFQDIFGFGPLEYSNIRWLLRRVMFKGDTLTHKIPFLAVIIHSVDLSHYDVTAVFSDETGEMNGIIVNSVIEKYPSLIAPGTVLLLKDVTVLSPSGFRVCVSLKEQQRKHYLNVTLNSILLIYSSEDNGKITKTEVSKFNKDELKSMIINVGNRCTERKAVVEESQQDNEIDAASVPLFSGFNDQYDSPNNETLLNISNQVGRSNFSSPIVNNLKSKFNLDTHSSINKIINKPVFNNSPKITDKQNNFSKPITNVKLVHSNTKGTYPNMNKPQISNSQQLENRPKYKFTSKKSYSNNYVKSNTDLYNSSNLATSNVGSTTIINKNSECNGATFNFSESSNKRIKSSHFDDDDDDDLDLILATIDTDSII